VSDLLLFVVYCIYVEAVKTKQTVAFHYMYFISVLTFKREFTSRLTDKHFYSFNHTELLIKVSLRHIDDLRHMMTCNRDSSLVVC
jgi:hypothetical protein